MAHYAFLDENNIVTEVIPGKDETDLSHNWEQYYGAIRGQVCKRTSYHGNYRKNYAGIGDTFDATKGTDGAFIAPKPFPSWLLNEETCQWYSPVPCPADGKRYKWDEATVNWIAV